VHTANEGGHTTFRPNVDLSLTMRRVDATILCHSFVAKPAMSLNPESKYPNRRAYVLKMRGDAKRDALVGRIENLVTGQQREFTSGHELLESIAGDLEAIVSERPVDADRK